MKKDYCVYKHTFPNNKVYIGITSLKVEVRWGKNGGYYLHKRKDCKYCQPLMAYAIQKYGWNNVVHEILFQNLTKEDAEQKEIELIAKYQSNNRMFGYNIANGGSVNQHTEETKKKIKEHHAHLSGENHPNYGKHLSEETKKRLSEINIGKVFSDETRKKLSESAIGNPHPKAWKPVICIETNVIYPSLKDAKEKTGIGHIGSVCNGKRETAGGYHWAFYEYKFKHNLK